MAKFFLLCKTFVLHGGNSTSWQNLYTSWLMLYLLTKPFSFMAKPLPFGKTFTSS
jgi:hypothetical protein